MSLCSRLPRGDGGGEVAQRVAATRPADQRGIFLVGSGPAKPAAHVTPEYQEALSRAYSSGESVAGVRDHILTASELPASVNAQIVTDSRTVTVAARSERPLRGVAQDITERTRMVGVPALVVADDSTR